MEIYSWQEWRGRSREASPGQGYPWDKGGTKNDLAVTLNIGDMDPVEGTFLIQAEMPSRAIETPTNSQNFQPKMYPSTRNAGMEDGAETEGMANQ